MALKQQRSGYAVAGQPGYEIGAAMNFGHDLVLDAGVVQQGLDVFDALDFVGRRVGGVETHPPRSQGDGIQIGGWKRNRWTRLFRPVKIEEFC